MIPFAQPHCARIKRPAASRDAATNVAALDYENPEIEFILAGMFQARQGNVVQLEDGRQYSLSGIFYTHDGRLQLDDLLTLDIPGTSESFLVTGRVAKYDMQGRLSHFEHPLTRNFKL
jgi:hypothetical protein